MRIKFKTGIILLTFQLMFGNIANCQKLKEGDKAPNFEAINTNGDTIRLDNYKGHKVLVAFFRYAGCPVCNFRVHELIEHYDSISNKGYKIIAIFESGDDTLKEYLKEIIVQFSVVGDPYLKLYKKYGVEKSFWKTFSSAFRKQPMQAMKKGNKLFSNKYKRDGSLTRIPADFLIDENGILTKVHYGKNIGDHLAITEILNN